MLLRHGVRPEVIDFVQHIKCSICIELSRKPSEPQTSSGKLEATAFRDLVGVDEFHVTLSDGHKVMLVMIIDVASRLAVSYPLARATTSVSAEELVESLERAWLSWGGPMKKLRADPAKAHLAAGVERFYSEHGGIPDITPAEGHNFQAVTERLIHAWKEVFLFVCSRCSVVLADRPWKWSSRIDSALNTHLRASGFSPYRFVFGRDPWVPTSTLCDDASLSAQSAAVYDSDAQHSELFRQIAVQRTLRLDSLQSLRCNAQIINILNETHHTLISEDDTSIFRRYQYAPYVFSIFGSSIIMSVDEACRSPVIIVDHRAAGGKSCY